MDFLFVEQSEKPKINKTPKSGRKLEIEDVNGDEDENEYNEDNDNYDSDDVDNNDQHDIEQSQAKCKTKKVGLRKFQDSNKKNMLHQGKSCGEDNTNANSSVVIEEEVYFFKIIAPDGEKVSDV